MENFVDSTKFLLIQQNIFLGVYRVQVLYLQFNRLLFEITTLDLINKNEPPDLCTHDL